MTTQRATAKIQPRPKTVPVATRVPFSFVHINKCGGSSVEIALGIEKLHATARELRDAIGAEDWAQRFTFSLVRNPFDRVVSIYYYRVRGGGGLEDRHINVNEWVERAWGARDPRYFNHPHLMGPQVGWLYEDETGGGERLVDFVGRLEEIDAAWSEITTRLGVQAALAKYNGNLHPSYRAVLSTRSRRILEQAFAADCAAFGYDW